MPTPLLVAVGNFERVEDFVAVFCFIGRGSVNIHLSGRAVVERLVELPKASFFNRRSGA